MAGEVCSDAGCLADRTQWARRVVGIAIALIAVGVGLALLTGQVQAAGDEVYFPQTGHHVSDPFLSYWRSNGGLAIHGYPITDVFERDGMDVQYFERAVFEQHAELAGTEHEVLLTLLGSQYLRQRAIPADALLQYDEPADHPSFRYFDATRFHVSFGFRDYWEDNGGLPVFGYPISREFEDPESGRTVQYFERARFEWHPEHKGTEYEILLERLGAVDARANDISTGRIERRPGIRNYDPSLWGGPIDIPALMYHRISTHADRYDMPLWRFEEQLDWLQSNGYETVTVTDVFDFLEEKRMLPEKPVIISFDDGHASNVAGASALNARGMKGVFYIELNNRGLSDSQIRDFADRGHEIGSHSLSHVDLTTVSGDRLAREVRDSRVQLQHISGQSVDFFAYPYGAYDSRAIAAVQAAGYRGANAAWGGKHWSTSKYWYQPRIEVSGYTGLREFAALVQ